LCRSGSAAIARSNSRAHTEDARRFTLNAKRLSRRGRGQGLSVAQARYRITIDPSPLPTA